MDLIRAFLLGVVQALTEFLPVSSSGHLAIANALLPEGANFQSLLIFAHLGTMLATVLVFGKEILGLIASLGSLPQSLREKSWKNEHRMLGIILLASIPTAVIGLGLSSHFEHLTSNLILVGSMLILTGILLLVTRFLQPGTLTEQNFGPGRALLLGLFQGMAILPGLSRSGTTISSSLILGSDRKFAGRVSFLISLPAIAGAGLLDILKGIKDSTFSGSLAPLAVVFATSFILGYIALLFLLKVIEAGRFYLFSIYCFLIGITVIVLRLTQVI